MIVAITAAPAAAAVGAAATMSSTMLTPEREDDGRQNGREHYESRAARCSDQHHVGRVGVRAAPPPVGRRPVIVRRTNVISVVVVVVVVSQRVINDQRQVECRRQLWTATVSGNHPQSHHLLDRTTHVVSHTMSPAPLSCINECLYSPGKSGSNKKQT